MRNSFHSCIVCLVPFAYSIVVYFYRSLEGRPPPRSKVRMI